MFYFDLIISVDVWRWSSIHRSWKGFWVSDTARCEDLVLTIKPVLFQTKIIQSDKVHNYKHHEWYVSSEVKIKYLGDFSIFTFLSDFSWCQIDKFARLKSSNWYMALRIDICTTWKSIISSYKIRFQNYWQYRSKFFKGRELQVVL